MHPLPTVADLDLGTPRRPRLPSLKSLTYAKELMTVALLALAFAWLLPRLATRPGATIDAVGKRVTGSRV